MEVSTAFRAAEFAARAHDGQYRKDGVTPYIVHPGRVAAMMALAMYPYPMMSGVSRTIVGAVTWLHDTIEDTKVTYEEIAKLFTSRIADMVMDLSNEKVVAGSRAVRKKHDRDRLAGKSEAVRMIKLADRLDNTMDLSDYKEDFQLIYAKESELLVAALLRDGMNLSGQALARGIHDNIRPILARA